jgi:hypothetical protein
MIQFCLILFFCLHSLNTYAELSDLTLIVEDEIPEAKHFILDVGLDFINASKVSAISSGVTSLQIGPNEFTLVSGPVSEQKSTFDQVFLSTGLRYGLSDDMQLQARISGFYSHTETIESSGITSNSGSGFSNLTLGLTRRLIRDKGNKGLLAFGSFSLAQRATIGDKTKNLYGRSFSLGVSGYTSIDPIVLSLNLSTNFNLKQRIADDKLQPGHNFVIAPTINFAVNDQITLSWGTQWLRQGSMYLNDKKVAISQTQTSMNFGLGYAPSKNLMVIGTFNTVVVGDDISFLNLVISKSF